MPESSEFALWHVLEASNSIRTVGAETESFEELGSEVVSYLRDHFADKVSGRSALPLVRMYVTRRCEELETSLQDVARAAGSDAPIGPSVVCLTLLATAGEESAWNDRSASVDHRAMPLPSVRALGRSPMIAQLIDQLGLDPLHLIEPEPTLFRDLSERAYNVFFVEEARDSPYVPAQNGFVIPYGIRSVVGFGGVLPDGMFFAVVLFSSVPISRGAVDAFAAVGLGVKISLLSIKSGKVFVQDGPRSRSPDDQKAHDWAVLEARATALAQLLDVRGQIVEGEALRLERETREASERFAGLEGSLSALKAADARSVAIIEGAPDGIIGIDATGRILDFNRAAESMFGYGRDEVLGELLSDVVIPSSMRERHRQGLSRFLATGEGPILGRRIEVNALRRDGSEFPIELVVTYVPDVEPPMFNGSVRDISAVRAALADLQAGQERLAHIARTLQASLLPPTLPEIEGAELAAAFHALGDGYEVGGDFYDAFELQNGSWGLVLGDVCGKGSDAAALTALARHTLRAAGMRSSDPTAVLSELNDAVHRQGQERFCTAAYATFDPRSGVVELGLGGHPNPYLQRANGELLQVGVNGLLLGPFEQWSGASHHIELQHGDTLFLYSDGVTEARSAKRFFGEDGLAAAIATTSGMGVRAAVERLETTVLAFAGALTDDLAILAVRRH